MYKEKKDKFLDIECDRNVKDRTWHGVLIRHNTQSLFELAKKGSKEAALQFLFFDSEFTVMSLTRIKSSHHTINNKTLHKIQTNNNEQHIFEKV